MQRMNSSRSYISDKITKSWPLHLSDTARTTASEQIRNTHGVLGVAMNFIHENDIKNTLIICRYWNKGNPVFVSFGNTITHRKECSASVSESSVSITQVFWNNQKCGRFLCNFPWLYAQHNVLVKKLKNALSISSENWWDYKTDTYMLSNVDTYNICTYQYYWPQQELQNCAL